MMTALLQDVGVYPWFQQELIIINYLSRAVVGRKVINLGAISLDPPALLNFSFLIACSSSVPANSWLSIPSTVGVRMNLGICHLCLLSGS